MKIAASRRRCNCKIPRLVLATRWLSHVLNPFRSSDLTWPLSSHANLQLMNKPIILTRCSASFAPVLASSDVVSAPNDGLFPECSTCSLRPIRRRTPSPTALTCSSQQRPQPRMGTPRYSASTALSSARPATPMPLATRTRCTSTISRVPSTTVKKARRRTRRKTESS